MFLTLKENEKSHYNGRERNSRTYFIVQSNSRTSLLFSQIPGRMCLFQPNSRTVVLVPAKVQDITLGQDKFSYITQYLSRTVFSYVESVGDGLLIIPDLDWCDDRIRYTRTQRAVPKRNQRKNRLKFCLKIISSLVKNQLFEFFEYNLGCFSLILFHLMVGARIAQLRTF